MRFIDRFTGSEINHLPARFLPGRYCLLDSLFFNEHSRLEAGDLLLDDGSGIVRIEGVEAQPLSIDQSADRLADFDLAAEAIIFIAGKIGCAHEVNVSPMMPTEMAAQCELEEIERKLSSMLKKGHLHTISVRPRSDLRYDDLVAPIARVHRLASSALSHLASHSDCWQQRTLRGVLPRKVLGQFSEDDYSIYENRLYKRLLDRLDRHLARRLARIRGVNARLERALEFQGSEQTHYRMRHDICSLWGESYLDGNTGAQLEDGKRALAEIEAQLRAIRGLKQSGLYPLVSSTSLVPAQVYRTNILNHDPHYRHLPSLWESLADGQEEWQMRPEERLAKYQELQRSYSDYVGLVILRALERYDVRGVQHDRIDFCWGGVSFSVMRKGLDWLISNTRGGVLRFVPVAWFGDSFDEDARPRPGHVVCLPGCAESTSFKPYLSITPLDLYVVEKMGRLVDEWMIYQLVEGYDEELGPLPTSVKLMVDGWSNNFQSVSSTHVRLVAPLSASQLSQLRSKLGEFANAEVERQVLCAADRLNALSRLCGHVAKFLPRVDGGFYCRCQKCKTTWTLNVLGNRKVFEKRPWNEVDLPSTDGFKWSGRDWLDFELPYSGR